MVEYVYHFPFRKLKYDKFLTLEVMKYVENREVCNFMFCVNNMSRSYIQDNFITIQNEFINEGLITYQLIGNFYYYE